MPKNCAVVQCNSSARMRERKFYRFPMLKHSSTKTLAITQIRQELWVRALNRIDFPPSRYKHATVCDRHFVSGRSAHYTDVDHVDWVPSLHLGYETLEKETESTESDRPSLYEIFEIKAEPNELDGDSNDERPDYLDEVTPDMDPDDIKDVLRDVTTEGLCSDYTDLPTDRQTIMNFEYVSSDTVSTQTDGAITGMSSDILRTYEAKIADLEAMLSGERIKVEQY
ncbi:uncharacterized protein LOC119079117 [Bradysia coprophila]|uniref:uncharacterized protein LOC119079117 n=1 Tax=Bradysia coprophila TaxID=38358 RepID=UPI00187D908B|nr:uncharacterized protein LOC119079117 [Bradysia coprophila]